MKNLLSVREIAGILKVHLNTIYKLVEEGRIPHMRLKGSIHFSEDEVIAWLEKGFHESNQIYESFPRVKISLDGYDKMHLKEESGLNNKKIRWNYGFGSIYVRKTKQGKERWYLDYRDFTGKRKQEVVKTAQTREEAVIALQNKVLAIFSSQNDVKHHKKIKFLEFADLYLKNYARVNKRSWKNDKSYLKGMKKFFKKFYLDEITSLSVERFKSWKLNQDVTKSTVNRYLAVLRKMLNVAKEWEYLPESRIIKFKLYSETDNLKERILRPEEEKNLFEAINPSTKYLKLILRVALHTGMRRGEILNLKWSQIDLDKKVIRVERTKSGKIRFIPINELLMREFLLQKQTKSSKFVFTNAATGKQFVDIKRAFLGACKRAGIENLRFHDLRHTFASRLVENGVDIITVKTLLGHSSVRITERYLHTQGEQKKKAVETLLEGKKSENLLHICDMENSFRNRKGLKSMFSVN